jgi:lysyl-tRNA synthetase class 2
MEVETPLLSKSTSMDPYLRSFSVVSPERAYLQTSPEFAMKRLLAAGSGPIYQICKAFREAESGHQHNPEFTMLEWYRPDFDLDLLMDEVEELVSHVIGLAQFNRSSYRQLFEDAYAVNPHEMENSQLHEMVLENNSIAESDLQFVSEDLKRSFCLDLLMDTIVSSRCQEPVFVFDYPVCQAALSTVVESSEGDLVARRFELYVNGIELANGYLELQDSAELMSRFENDRKNRRLLGLQELPAAKELLDAMEAGLPGCSGVALGIDRLLMVQEGLSSINQVVAFPWNIA